MIDAIRLREFLDELSALTGRTGLAVQGLDDQTEEAEVVEVEPTPGHYRVTRYPHSHVRNGVRIHGENVGIEWVPG